MAAILNSELLYAALRKAGVQIAPGRGPGPAQIADAIKEENRMIGGWNLSPLVVLGESIDLWDTIASQQSYTIGIDPSGTNTADWPGERPLAIIRANLLLPTSTTPVAKVRRPLRIWDARQWGEICFQAVYTYPYGLYQQMNDPALSPFSRIFFKPIPDDVYQVEFITRQRIPKFAAASDEVYLPDGYEDAIVNNLAVRLASYPWVFQRPMDPQVRVDATLALYRIQQANTQSPRLKTELGLRGGGGLYSWRSGQVEP